MTLPRPIVNHVAGGRLSPPKGTRGQDSDYLQAIRDKIATDRATRRLYAKTPLDDTDAVIFNGEVKTVLVRKPLQGQKCVIDWLNVVISMDDFIPRSKHELSDTALEDYVINQISRKLLKIIGFAIDVENQTGRNFYKRSFSIEHNAGFVCIGGQKNTVLIMINGTGCNYANIDFEFDLFDWLDSLKVATITRIDLAYDSLDKTFLTVDLFDQIHSNGGFNKGGRNPEIEYRGNWKKPNGKGRTLYIGSRQSSKFCRIYEKGKQLGDQDSIWLRIEVEFKSRDIYIPLSVLLHPTDYMVAAYPCFYLIEEDTPLDKYEVRDKNELITFAQAIRLVQRQYGRYIHFFRQCFDDDKILMDILTDIPNKSCPEKLDVLTIPKDLNTPKTLIISQQELNHERI